MADKEILVYVDLNSGPFLVGRLWSRFGKGRESAAFEYDRAWLAHPERFALEPALRLDPGPHHTGHDQRLFGALGDSAPDRWGRALMRRGERRTAALERRSVQTLGEIDFLLRVDDEARQGALRFAWQQDGPFLAAAGPGRIPPLVELPNLLAASQHAASETETDEELRLLLAPGSSVGGARPKAVVRDQDGTLSIAKFPHPNDEYDHQKWEAVALSLANQAGIEVPVWRLETIAGKSVLLSRRFDRQTARRIPFLSAMSLLAARDNEQHNYLEIVDALRRYGAQPRDHARALWRRIVFNVLISNTDDHLRNHGFLYAGGAGWRLSPAYDLNPVPVDIKARVLTTWIDPDENTASLELALTHADYFDLDRSSASRIAGEVGKAVSQWRTVAKKCGLSATAMERMRSAFEHDDLKTALAFAGS
jgi:serine/threonine-protein kinase HipA